MSAPEHASHKHGPGRYVAVWAALLVFTALTVGLGRIHLAGGWSIVIAMAIATVKASLVVLFFMHMKEHGGASRLVLATTVVFVALLMGLVLLDNATRFPLSNPPSEATLPLMPPGPDATLPTAVPAKAAAH